VASLGELYFFELEIDGFGFVGIGISRYDVVFYYLCLDGSRDSIMILVNRDDSELSPDEDWEILVEHQTRPGRGYLTDDGMIYNPRTNSFSARMGNTALRMVVPDRLNSYEFLRALALEVIGTAELVVLMLPHLLCTD